MSRTFLSQLTGSFSMPAAENPTVVMMEAAYRHHGLDWRYLNCEVTPALLADAVRGARAMNWAGFNCSIPHKVAVIDHLDGLGESAQIIGAVNTVVRRGDRYIGENTDGRGFIASLPQTFDCRGRSALLLGAGGAARAIAVELALSGIGQILVLNRDAGRGRELASLISGKTAASAEAMVWDGVKKIPQQVDLVVNATSIGLYPGVSACPDIDPDSLRPEQLVADVIPNPPETAFLQAAKQRGCTVLDGLGMLVAQGALALQYWTGVEVDRSVMRRELASVFDSTE
ncbi:MAG: shikimate dehydrogenase [Oceanospirillaceae bacterium]|nr:shikimate dehydrogenase [Oceanospirillaceae bacterium]